MKIYEIGTGYTPIPAQMGAATEIVVEELTRSFLNQGESVQIIDIAASERAKTDLPIIEVKVPSAFTKKDVSLGIMHKLKRVVYSVALAGKLKKLIKASDEKVILHFHNQYNLFFFLKLVSKRIREKAVIAYTVHSYIWGTEWSQIEDTVKKKYFQEVFCVKNADAVFVLNDITIQHFTEKLGVDKSRIRKIINGVNTHKYSPYTKEKINEIKKAEGLENKKIIFQVGSVCDRKNQFGSVQMLCEYLKTHPDVVYMYAGGVIDAEYQQKIVDFARDNGISDRVRYLGELSPGDELARYYNVADCSVFTSKLESFGLVIIEAISSGTPVVLSGEPMFELTDGYSVYNTQTEFVECVDKFLCADGFDFSQCAQVISQYNWDTVAKLHKELLEKID